MKRTLLSIMVLVLAGNSFAQKGFGIDGSLGFGFNGGQTVYPILLEGRVQWSDYFSSNIGLGLWNSGFKETWPVDQATTRTLYRLSDNQTVPSLQLSIRGQLPFFKIFEKKVCLFAEPRLCFLPFSERTVNMNEVYYNIKTDLIGNVTYNATGKSPTSTDKKSESHPRLYGGIQGGLSIELIDNVDFALSYGYTNMDLFKDLRGLDIEGWSLDNYLPRKDLQMISIGICVHYDLN